MKCSKCGYDYPAKDTKCPYCGEPNKLGMEWQEEEDNVRKDTLLTKARVLHSMPLYVANKILTMILLLFVLAMVLIFISIFISAVFEVNHKEHLHKRASVTQAEELYAEGDYAALADYLYDHQVYGEDGYDKYTERVRIYNMYDHLLEDAMELREQSDWEKNTSPRKYVVSGTLENAQDILLQDDYSLGRKGFQYEENREYFKGIQQDTLAVLMGTLEMTQEEVEAFLQIKTYSDEMDSYVKMIYERKGWEYEEN